MIICAVVCMLLMLSVITLYKELRKELMRFGVIRRCFPK